MSGAMRWQANKLSKRISDLHKQVEDLRIRSTSDPGNVANVLPSALEELGANLEELSAIEEVMKESEEEMRLVTDGMPLLLAHISSDLHYLFVNRTYSEWIGLPISNIIGRHISEILPEEGLKAALPNIKRVLSGEKVTYDITISRDGQKKYLNITLVPQADELGDVRAYYSITQDITESKKAGEALKENEMLLRQTQKLIETVTRGTEVIIATLDLNLRYTFFNMAYEQEIKRLTGKKIAIGTSMLDLFEDMPEQQEIAAREWNQALLGEITSKILEFGDLGFYRRVYRVLHTPIRDATGK